MIQANVFVAKRFDYMEAPFIYRSRETGSRQDRPFLTVA